MNVGMSDAFTKSVGALVYHCDLENRVMATANPATLFAGPSSTAAL